MIKEECYSVLEDERCSWKASIIYENCNDYGNETICDYNANICPYLCIAWHIWSWANKVDDSKTWINKYEIL